MTYVVAFDGSELSEAALERAAEVGTARDVPLVAVAVIPGANRDYASEKGWTDGNEPFDAEVVVDELRDRVESLAPEAAFRYRLVDRYARRGRIAAGIRRTAREVDADMVFVGSENAGRLVTSVTSVASSVAADRSYDVVIVRCPRSGDGS